MRLGEVLRGYRAANRLGVRALAKTIGVSHATLNRIEHDEGASSDTLAKILLWLIGKEGTTL